MLNDPPLTIDLAVEQTFDLSLQFKKLLGRHHVPDHENCDLRFDLPNLQSQGVLTFITDANQGQSLAVVKQFANCLIVLFSFYIFKPRLGSTPSWE